MIIKKFKKLGKIRKPFFTQHNEQVISDKLGKIRSRIENEITDTPYDLYEMVADQAKRIDILEALLKEKFPNSILTPLIEGDVTETYKKISKRMRQIHDIVKGE